VRRGDIILTDPNGYSEEIYGGWVNAWR